MMSDTLKFNQAFSDMPAKDYPIRDVFQTFYPEYAASHSVSSEQSKAARCICECKTGSLGYNISFCEKCGHVEVHACSCNNRNCPCCQSPQEQKWIIAHNSELIEKCAYYHSIFTAPYELNDLMFENQKLLYNLMFSCASDAVLLSYNRIHKKSKKFFFTPAFHAPYSSKALDYKGYQKQSKLHMRSACVTWFKGKVLNQGLEVLIRLLILNP